MAEQGRATSAEPGRGDTVRNSGSTRWLHPARQRTRAKTVAERKLQRGEDSPGDFGSVLVSTWQVRKSIMGKETSHTEMETVLVLNNWSGKASACTGTGFSA